MTNQTTVFHVSYEIVYYLFKYLADDWFFEFVFSSSINERRREGLGMPTGILDRWGSGWHFWLKPCSSGHSYVCLFSSSEDDQVRVRPDLWRPDEDRDEDEHLQSTWANMGPASPTAQDTMATQISLLHGTQKFVWSVHHISIGMVG